MPQPGSEHRLICTEIAVATNVGELGDLPGDKALATARVFGSEVNLDAHVLAKQGLGRDAGGVAEQPHPELEQPGYLLGALHRAKFQLLAQRAVGNKSPIPHCQYLVFY